jgi:DNA-binding NtrC family response regulator
MAATHCDLEAAIAEGRFRADLYYRLNVISIRIPPLRERKDEIVPLAEFLLQKHAAPGTVPPPITAELRQVLLSHHWPGNVRELENAMRRLLVFPDPGLLAQGLREESLRIVAAASGNGERLSIPDRSPAEEAAPGGNSVLEMVDEARKKAEIKAILAALDSTHWNRKQAARVLGIDYKALLYRMKKLSIGEQPPVGSQEPEAPQGAPLVPVGNPMRAKRRLNTGRGESEDYRESGDGGGAGWISRGSGPSVLNRSRWAAGSRGESQAS